MRREVRRLHDTVICVAYRNGEGSDWAQALEQSLGRSLHEYRTDTLSTVYRLADQ